MTSIWAHAIGETDLDADEVDGIAIDDNDRTYASGVFRGEVRFGDTTFTSAGEGDVFLASYARDGSLRWARQIGGVGDDNTFDLQSDGHDVVASGWFAGTVDFGGTTLSSAGSQDMFLARFDSRGRLEWARSFGGAAGDGGNELDVLPSGEIAVAAISDGAFTVDGTTYPYGGGGRDAYAMRVTGAGDVVWVHPFNGPGTERIRAMAIDGSGEVFVGFQYRGSVSAGGTSLVSRGDWDGAAAKLTPDGEPLWLIPFGGPGVDNVRGIAPAGDGSAYASGVFADEADLAGRAASGGANGDDYLMRLSGAGAPEWLVLQSGAGPSTGAEIRSDERGVIASSVLSGAVELTRDGSQLASLTPPGGNPTSMLNAYDPEGNLRFSYSPTATGVGSGALGDVLAISPDGRWIAQALRFTGLLDTGPAQLSTPAARDSAIVFLRGDARARVRVRRVTPRRLRLRPGRWAALKVIVRNEGDAVADQVDVCPEPLRSARRRIRVGRCVKGAPLGPGARRRIRIVVRARHGAPAGRAGLRLRLISEDSRSVAVAARVRIRRR
ncbi:MAG: hypothetical protein U0R24_01855 [Solirubrobacterales bacterium]